MSRNKSKNKNDRLNLSLSRSGKSTATGASQQIKVMSPHIHESLLFNQKDTTE